MDDIRLYSYYEHPPGGIFFVKHRNQEEARSSSYASLEAAMALARDLKTAGWETWIEDRAGKVLFETEELANRDAAR